MSEGRVRRERLACPLVAPHRSCYRDWWKTLALCTDTEFYQKRLVTAEGRPASSCCHIISSAGRALGHHAAVPRVSVNGTKENEVFAGCLRPKKNKVIDDVAINDWLISTNENHSWFSFSHNEDFFVKYMTLKGERW